MSCRVNIAWCVAAAILFLLCAGHIASAQRTSSSFPQAWSGFNSQFLYTDSHGNDQFANKSGVGSPSGLWTSANMIDMAVQAYNWAAVNDTSLAPSIKTEITSLCNGFRDRYGDNWSSNSYDDDLMWATITFVDAYDVTGTTQYLTDAENAFNTVYSRGYDTTFGGGIWWNSACKSGCSGGSKVSASNWTFAIAGHLLHADTGNSTYSNEANSVHIWAKSYLYNSSTGEIYDGVSGSGTNTSQYTYNYGVALGAMSMDGASNTTMGQVADYLFHSLPNYNGTTSEGGYKILPNYRQGGTDGGGFTGIALKWVGFCNGRGQIPAADMEAAEANVDQAWSKRNSHNVAWNNWNSTTVSSPEYSWDDSDAVFGMANIPLY
jgi:predicted alpha-1,6-mannanase (GH76 family)